MIVIKYCNVIGYCTVPLHKKQVIQESIPWLYISWHYSQTKVWYLNGVDSNSMHGHERTYIHDTSTVLT